MLTASRQLRVRVVSIAACALLAALGILAVTLLAASASAAPVKLNASNSSIYWVGVAAPDSVNTLMPAVERFACPEREYVNDTMAPQVYSCAAEFYLPGGRWFFAAGQVKWTNLTWSSNASGQIFNFGTPHSSVGYRYSWTRRWHVDSAACLRGGQVSGYVLSNMPCETVASAISHGNPRLGQIVGTGSGYWPWLNSYPCRRARGWTTCANQVGDAYKFQTYPNVGP